MSLAGPRRWNKSLAYSRALAAAITAHPAVMAYVQGLRDVADKARRVDAAGHDPAADFEAAMRDLHAALDHLAETTGGSGGEAQG